ncbi:PREDICTED: RING finger protein 141-like isoform X2 [Priapulus caudatus]|nr:PREDICTED: RING finger protein 141-like isoform X2 [Priapulus caudatus]XP_014677391.1 PREDICTED: RING finger protein 141-like isoform X2 [Priapulus caudatus]
MGAVNSSLAEPITVSSIQEILFHHAGTLKRLATLTYEDFLGSVEELNKITLHLYEPNGKKLCFAVKNGTDDSVLWKGTVRIRCVKMNGSTVESSRLLNLRQFVNFYNVIKQHAATLAPPISAASSVDFDDLGACAGGSGICDGLEASVLLQKLACGGAADDVGEECCICMDRKPDVLLPCTHHYCQLCIEQWNVTSKTCPICRHRVNSAKDSWVITEVPDSHKMQDELRDYMMTITDSGTT